MNRQGYTVDALSWSNLFFWIAAVAMLFAIVQAMHGASRKRATASKSGVKPPTPAPPSAPVPPKEDVRSNEHEPADEDEPADRTQPTASNRGSGAQTEYQESRVEMLLGGWSPFYTFLFAVAMFGFGFIAWSQVPKPSSQASSLVLYAPTPGPTPTPEPSSTATSANVTPETNPATSPTSSPTPSPTATPTPIPTYSAIPCTAKLTVQNETISAGGSGFVTYVIDCHGHTVLQPELKGPYVVTNTGTISSPKPIEAPATGNLQNSNSWAWVVSAPQSTSSPSASVGGGVTTVVYVAVTSAKGTPTSEQGTATTINVRERTTIDSLTAWVQGLAGFFGAVIALIAGIKNFLKPVKEQPSGSSFIRPRHDGPQDH